VIATAVEPVTAFFSRYKVPRVATVIMVYLGLIALLSAFFTLLFPPLIQETSGFLSTVPEYLESSVGLAGPAAPADPSNQLVDETFVTSLRDLGTTFSNSSGGILSALASVFGGLLSFVLIIVLSFYFAVQERGIDDFLELVTPVKHKAYVLNLWQRSQIKIGRWMQGQLFLSFIVGVLVYVGLTILDVRYALLLAILAAIFELIPVFGSILAAVPAVLVALIDGGAGLALWVTAWYLIVNQFQANIVYPLVVQKVLGVPPLLVILSLIVGGQLAGFLGILLSVPMAAVLREFVNDLQKEKHHQAKVEPSLPFSA